MGIVNRDEWRVMIKQDDGDFMRDQLVLYVAQRELGGSYPGSYRPVTLTVEIGEPISTDLLHTTDFKLPESRIPTELCEVLLAALARYLLSVPEGDLAATIQRLRTEKERTERQLESLIAGIGRMGGKA